jgi:hypothetical protein
VLFRSSGQPLADLPTRLTYVTFGLD